METDLESSTPYKLGQMDARIGNIENAVASIQADVKVLLARDAQQKGGNAKMATIGVGGVSVGGLVVAIGQWLGIGGHVPAPQPAPIPYVQPQAVVPQQPQRPDQLVNPTTSF